MYTESSYTEPHISKRAAASVRYLLRGITAELLVACCFGKAVEVALLAETLLLGCCKGEKVTECRD